MFWRKSVEIFKTVKKVGENKRKLFEKFEKITRSFCRIKSIAKDTNFYTEFLNKQIVLYGKLWQINWEAIWEGKERKYSVTYFVDCFKKTLLLLKNQEKCYKMSSFFFIKSNNYNVIDLRNFYKFVIKNNKKLKII